MAPIVDYFTLLAAAARTVLTAPWPQNWRRLKFLFLFAVIWPLLKTITVPCLLLDHVFYPDFRKVRIKEPIFIVGNLRTGSTLLYRTLARDEQAFSFYRMLDAFLPAITMKRAASALGRLDEALGGHGVRLLQRMDETFLAEYSRIHDTGFLKPEEDDFALLTDLCSASMFELFPAVRRFRRFFFLDQEMSEPERRWVMSRYLGLVRRQLYHQGAHKRFVSKNPLFTNKLGALAATFPDARFVCLVRNPVSTVASTASLFHFVWHETGALPPGERNMEQVMEFCRTFYRYPEEKLRPMGDRAAFVIYDDLVADPSSTIRRIFEGFGFPVPASLEGVLAEANVQQTSWRNPHRYSTRAWGISEDEIYKEFEDVYVQYGFPPPEPTAG